MMLSEMLATRRLTNQQPGYKYLDCEPISNQDTLVLAAQIKLKLTDNVNESLEFIMLKY